MSQFSAAARVNADDQARMLFKDDRPRRIDRFIDYFGNTAAEVPADSCGERRGSDE